MLHALPITNVRLLACHEDWHRMTPTERGRHCQSCNREVVDFTQASMAELHRAQAAASDGRVCGRFRQSQLTDGRPVRFGLWARAFVLAVALLFGQGLTAREAWAQTQRARPTKAAQRPAATQQQPGSIFSDSNTLVGLDLSGLAEEEAVLPDSTSHHARPASLHTDTTTTRTPIDTFEGRPVYAYAEPMPAYPGGDLSMYSYIQRHLRYPREWLRAPHIEGQVLVTVIVDREGQVQRPIVTQSLGPAGDVEALRVVRLLGRFEPGRRDGQPVDVRYQVAVYFKFRPTRD